MKRLFSALALVCALTLTACGGSPAVKHKHHQHGYHTPYGLQAHAPGFGKHPKSIPLPPPLSRTAASQTLLMLDSVDTTANSSTWNGITPTVVAGYLPPSSWPTFAPFLSEFPHAIHVAVDVQSYAHGDRRAAISCLDDEPGDASPSEAGPWVAYEVAHHFRPCVYFSLSERSAVQASVSAQHIHVHVFYWCADWTYFAHLDAGCDAVQWSDHYLGRNIDASTVDFAFVGKGVKPPAPTVRCFHKGWPQPASDKTLCLKVRAQDAAQGKQIAREQAFLKVSQQNITTLQGKLNPITGKLSAIEKRAASELAKHHFLQLKVSASNAIPLEAQAAPLQAQLNAAQANAKTEQSKITSDSATLHASLKKYGW